MSKRLTELLRFASALQHARTFEELLLVVREEVRRAVGYNEAWLFVSDDPAGRTLRLIGMVGPKDAAVRQHARVLVINDDAMVTEIMSARGPVVVEDARTDPRTDKRIVEHLGNRTIVNIPLILPGGHLGAFGTGTFAPDECRVPTPDALDYLADMAGQVSAAAERIRWLDERHALLLRQQRLESMGLLAAGVAHDFNNFLTVISTQTSRLAKEPLTARQTDAMDAVNAATIKAAELARQLSAVGREQPIKLEPTDVNARIRALGQLLAKVLPPAIDIELRLDPDAPMVLADGGHLDQVIMNLCLNARDAMPSGGELLIASEPEIIGDAAAREDVRLTAGRHLRISVTDRGTGIEPAVLEHIFEPYITTKAPGQGTGLGLAVAWGVVQRHAGTIECHSSLGVGTTFTVRLPAML